MTTLTDFIESTQVRNFIIGVIIFNAIILGFETSSTMMSNFGTLGQSAYSLFQIMTLESWSMGIVRPVMEVYPYAWVFFVPFIVITTFAVVNLLVGLIVNSMQDAHHEDEHAEALAHRDELMLRLDAIEKKLDRLSK